MLMEDAAGAAPAPMGAPAMPGAAPPPGAMGAGALRLWLYATRRRSKRVLRLLVEICLKSHFRSRTLMSGVF